jgi:hypothetical protein
LQHESVEHRADGVRPFAALLSVADIISSIMAPDRPSPASGATSRLSTRTCSAVTWAFQLRAIIRQVEARLAGGSSGQGQKQLADGHGTPPRLQIRAAFLAHHGPVAHHMADGCEVRKLN